MRLLIGAAYQRTPNSGAGGSVLQSINALRDIGCDVDEFWRADLGRRIQHGNLHYALELPRAFRRVVADRCAKKIYDAVILSQPHAYLAGHYIHKRCPMTLFINRSHGWEGEVDELIRKWEKQNPRPPLSLLRWLRGAMRCRLRKHQDWVVEEADGMVVGAQTTKNWLLANYILSADRIAVIPDGIVDSYIETRPKGKSSDKWRRILYVGQYARVKAPEQVASIISDVLQTDHAAGAGWVCDAQHHNIVRAMLNERVRDRVIFYPWLDQSQLIDVFDAHGLFLFPSWYEGYGKTPLEAMSRGLVVVCSRVGGPADLIRHAENGYLFSNGDIAGMSACLRELMNNPAQAQRIGEAARASVKLVTWRNYALELVRHVERWKSKIV